METSQGNYTRHTPPFLNNNSTQQQTAARNMKRKVWDDDEEDGYEKGSSSQLNDTSLHRVDLGNENLVSPPNLIASSIHHRYLHVDKPSRSYHHLHQHPDLSVPTPTMDQRQREPGGASSQGGGGEDDSEMTCGYTPMSGVDTPNSGHMSVDISVASSVDQEDLEEEEQGLNKEKEGIDNSHPSRRTKQKLDLVALSHLGLVSEVDVQRAQSGDRVLDIFQECFYNAASR
ncbi:hypothetical protein BG003_000421 [Podila horticola]|nr:hypothetical protein BG003_000421 [Podila horticola]